MSNRTCNVCKVAKPLTDYYVDNSRLLGREYQCKKCSRAKCMLRYHTMKTTPKYKTRHRKSQAQFRKKYPEKTKAHQLAKKIPLASECEQCGDTGKIHRHHPDYSKPLEVKMLCVKCHEIAHHGVLV